MNELELRFRTLLVVVIFIVGVSGFAAGAQALKPAPQTLKAWQLGEPLHFEPSQGQARHGARLVARGGGFAVTLEAGRATLALPKNTVTLRWLGADPQAKLMASEPQASISNYYVGNDPSQWRTAVPNYGRVTERGIYPGVDLTFYGNGGRLESDWMVAPGADPGTIRFLPSQSGQWRLGGDGSLRLPLPEGSLRLLRPRAYQLVNGRRRAVAAQYQRASNGTVSFRLGRYDHQRQLIIDPVLTFVTYLGATGTKIASGNAVAVAGNGDVYVAGGGGTAEFPGAGCSGQINSQGLCEGAYVAEFNSSGQLVSTSVLSGQGFSATALALAVDSAGNIYLAGSTFAANFPTQSGLPLSAYLSNFIAYQITNFGAVVNGLPSTEIFVAKLAPHGAALIYSTLFGGQLGSATCGNTAAAIAVDGNGNAFFTGDFGSPEIAGINALPGQSVFKQGQLGPTFQCSTYLAELQFDPLSSTLSMPLFTYFGGLGDDNGSAVALDGQGDVYLGGTTDPNGIDIATWANFPLLLPLPGIPNNMLINFEYSAGFVAEIQLPSATEPAPALLYSTILPGTEVVSGLAVSGGDALAAGDAVTAGCTDQLEPGLTAINGLPASELANLRSCDLTGFVMDLHYDPAGPSLAPAFASLLPDQNDLTYPLGGVGALAADGSANVFVGAGSNLAQLNFNAATQALGISYEINVGGPPPAPGTGSSGQVKGVAIDPSGDIVVTGTTQATNLATANVFGQTFTQPFSCTQPPSFGPPYCILGGYLAELGSFPVPVPHLISSGETFSLQAPQVPSTPQFLLLTNGGHGQMALDHVSIIGPNAGDFSLSSSSACASGSGLNQGGTPPLPEQSLAAIQATLVNNITQLQGEAQVAGAQATLEGNLTQSDINHLESFIYGAQVSGAGDLPTSTLLAAMALIGQTNFQSGNAANSANVAGSAAATATSAASAATSAAASATSAANAATLATSAAGSAANAVGCALNPAAEQQSLPSPYIPVLGMNCPAVPAPPTSAAYTPQVVAPSGNTATALQFGPQTIGTTITQQVYLLDGDASGQTSTALTLPFTVSGANTPDFNVTSNCVNPLTQGCSISISFTPSQPSPEAAVLTINNGSTANPSLQLPLSGTGLAPGTPYCPSGSGAPGLIAGAAPSFGTNNPVGILNGQPVMIAATGCSAVSLNSSSVAITGPQAADFTIGGGANCGASIPAGQSCQLLVVYAGLPTNAGQTENAQLTVSGMAANSVPVSVSVPLTAAAISNQASYSAPQLNFNFLSSSTQSLTLTNTANGPNPGPLVLDGVAGLGGGGPFRAPFNYSLACSIGGSVVNEANPPAYPITLNPGDNCNFSITMDSAVPQWMVVSDNALESSLTSASDGNGYVQMVCLSVDGSACPAFPDPPNIANTYLGTALQNTNLNSTTLLANLASQTLKTTQAAQAAAEAARAAAALARAEAGAQQELSTLQAPGAGQGACLLGVQFTPGGVGPRNAALEIFDSAGSGYELIPLSGSGAPAQLPAAQFSSSNSALLFAPQAPGTQSSQALTLTNNNASNESLNLGIVGDPINNATDFTESNNCQAVAPGGNCTVTVGFNPLASGMRIAALVNSNADGSVTTLAGLTGSGVVVTAAPAALPFGNQTLNAASGALTVTLSSGAGTAPTLAGLTIQGDGTPTAAPGDFAILNTGTCAGAGTIPNNGCTVEIAFTPSALGPRTAMLAVSDNGGASPQKVVLTGTGTPAPACATDVSSSVSITRGIFGPAPIRGLFAQRLTLTNTGASSLSGTIMVALDSLTNAALVDAAGATSCSTPSGSPLLPAVPLGGTLAPGQTITVTLTFRKTNNLAITYSTRVLAGPGQP